MSFLRRFSSTGDGQDAARRTSLSRRKSVEPVKVARRASGAGADLGSISPRGTSFISQRKAFNGPSFFDIQPRSAADVPDPLQTGYMTMFRRAKDGGRSSKSSLFFVLKGNILLAFPSETSSAVGIIVLDKFSVEITKSSRGGSVYVSGDAESDSESAYSDSRRGSIPDSASEGAQDGPALDTASDTSSSATSEKADKKKKKLGISKKGSKSEKSGKKDASNGAGARSGSANRSVRSPRGEPSNVATTKNGRRLSGRLTPSGVRSTAAPAAVVKPQHRRAKSDSSALRTRRPSAPSEQGAMVGEKNAGGASVLLREQAGDYRFKLTTEGSSWSIVPTTAYEFSCATSSERDDWLRALAHVDVHALRGSLDEERKKRKAVEEELTNLRSEIHSKEAKALANQVAHVPTVGSLSQKMSFRDAAKMQSKSGQGGSFISTVKPEYQGWLKMQVKGKRYKKRFFALKGDFLCYFKDNKDKHPHGVIYIADNVLIQPAEQDTGKKHCFSIGVPGYETFYEVAETAEEMQMWIKSLRDVQMRSKVERSRSSPSSGPTPVRESIARARPNSASGPSSPTAARARARSRAVSISVGLQQMMKPPVGSVAIVFTDVEGSTELWDQLPEEMDIAIELHNILIRRGLGEMDGYEVKTEGDGWMIAFENPVDAVNFCTWVQEALLTVFWPDRLVKEGKTSQNVVDPDSNAVLFRGLRLKMGVHYGECRCREDKTTRRMDYFGPVVNQAARTMGVARGGEILVSNVVHEMIVDHPAQVGTPIITFHGEHRMKGISEAQQVWSITARALEGRVPYFARAPPKAVE